MADKGPGSTGRSSKKRLARAKIKATDEGIKSAKGRKPTVEPEMTKTQQKKARQKKITAIAVGIFAVIMALSMTLPSLSYIFGNSDEQQAAQQAQEEADAAAQEAENGEEEEETEELTGMAAVDDAYKAVIDPLEEKLKDNPKDLATLLHLGKDYMAWGYDAGSYASEDADYEHLNELFAKAMDYYDQYLELNDSPAVKCDRAMCQLYTGDLEGAVAALEQVTADENYGPAWANLGMIHEIYQGDNEGAKEAYQKAIDADPDDEYGSKSYANRRLAAMVASANNGELEDAATETTEDDAAQTEEGASALAEALASHQ